MNRRLWKVRSKEDCDRRILALAMWACDGGARCLGSTADECPEHVNDFARPAHDEPNGMRKNVIGGGVGGGGASATPLETSWRADLSAVR